MASWAHFRDKYEQEILTELAPNTEKKAIGVLNAIEEAINPTRVSDITHDNLSTYIKTMREKGRAGATIAGHITHLKSALGFAVKWKMITTLPDMPDLKRVKRSNMMKGRPITLEEHERMLEATTEIVGDKADESWQYFQRGLWASGLRLDEALHLTGIADCKSGDCLEVKLDGRNSLLVIPAEMEKGNQDRLLPMAPEFARFLEETPEADRQGPVFKFHNRKSGKLGTVKMQWASTVICDIGEQARVVVNKKSGKFASAHDLRRAFGQRWAAKVMPQILMQLMRHRDISTTMKYYVGSEAETTANVLWEADEKPRGQKVAI
jgi:integrase